MFINADKTNDNNWGNFNSKVSPKMMRMTTKTSFVDPDKTNKHIDAFTEL